MEQVESQSGTYFLRYLVELGDIVPYEPVKDNEFYGYLTKNFQGILSNTVVYIRMIENVIKIKYSKYTKETVDKIKDISYSDLKNELKSQMSGKIIIVKVSFDDLGYKTHPKRKGRKNKRNRKEKEYGTYFLSYLAELGFANNDDMISDNTMTGELTNIMNLNRDYKVHITMKKPNVLKVLSASNESIEEIEDEDDDVIWWEDTFIKTKYHPLVKVSKLMLKISYIEI